MSFQWLQLYICWIFFAFLFNHFLSLFTPFSHVHSLFFRLYSMTLDFIFLRHFVIFFFIFEIFSLISFWSSILFIVFFQFCFYSSFLNLLTLDILISTNDWGNYIFNIGFHFYLIIAFLEGVYHQLKRMH